MENSIGNLDSDAFMAKIFRSSLKKYFEVDHSYVITKFKFILFPFIIWNKNNGLLTNDDFNTQIENKNNSDSHLNPDLYLPLMFYISYVLLCCIRFGVSKADEYNLDI